MSDGAEHMPRWLRDLERFLPLKSQFVLSGNVRDLQAVDFQGSTIPAYLVPVLEGTLRSKSYEAVLLYDPITGFQSSTAAPEHCNADIAFMGEVGLRASDGVAPGGTTLLQNTLKRVVSQNRTRAALLIDFASRLSVHHDYLSNEESLLEWPLGRRSIYGLTVRNSPKFTSGSLISSILNPPQLLRQRA